MERKMGALVRKETIDALSRVQNTPIEKTVEPSEAVKNTLADSHVTVKRTTPLFDYDTGENTLK